MLPTKVLLQAGLDIKTSAVYIAVILFRQTSFSWAFVYIFNRAAVPGGQYKLSHLQQYLFVGGNDTIRPANIRITPLSHFDYKHPQLSYNYQIVTIEFCGTKIKIEKYGTTK